MRLLPRRAPFPLLGRELTEQAARPRTYLLRVLYALALFASFFVYWESEAASHGPSPMAMLGQGRRLLQFLVYVQFGGIIIFLPVLMAGALTYEKERNSLGLLFLTDLRPGEIVLEKFAGRLVPMFTFLLLALPLLAACYALGGLTAGYLWSGVLLLVVACLQVGALSLMLSAFCATTTQAFIGSYVGLGVVYFGLAAADLVLAFLTGTGSSHAGILLALAPPYLFVEASWRTLDMTVVRAAWPALTAVVFLVMARVFVRRRAFVRPRSWVLAVFKRLDAFWHRANRLTGGIVLIKDSDRLPGKQPITWQEVNKRSLGKASHLARLLCIFAIPASLVAVAMVAVGGGRAGTHFLTLLISVTWPLAVLAVVVPSATAFPYERTRRTLDLLLATPLSGREIVQQKARGRWRLMAVLAVAILCVAGVEAYWEWGEQPYATYGYLASSLLSVAIYLPLFTWLSLWIGLRMRTPTRAAVGALAVIAVWCFGPLLLGAALEEMQIVQMDRPPAAWLWLLSPVTVPFLAEISVWELRTVWEASPWMPILVNYAYYAAIMLALRWLCLSRAERYLGRLPERKAPPEQPEADRTNP
ncbi:MAG: ABC transporter permease subunit [Candidatus Brocadiia bacterium]